MVDDTPARRYRLVGADGAAYASTSPGTLGGHRGSRVYGRLDCPGALRHLEKGGYAPSRVFFADERTARAAGYRPCSECLRARYELWWQGADAPRGRVARLSSSEKRRMSARLLARLDDVAPLV